MTDTEAAYLAGIVDGEGCIGIGRRKKYITVTLQISNTDLALLGWVKDKCGGNIYPVKNSRIDNRKQAYVWSRAGRIARDIIVLIRPYLIVKAAQADIVLGIKRYSPQERDTLGRVKGVMTPADFAENEAIFANVRQLNRRGR